MRRNLRKDSGISWKEWEKVSKMVLAFHLVRSQCKVEREQRQGGCHPTHALSSGGIHSCEGVYISVVTPCFLPPQTAAWGNFKCELGPVYLPLQSVGNPYFLIRTAEASEHRSSPFFKGCFACLHAKTPCCTRWWEGAYAPRLEGRPHCRQGSALPAVRLTKASRLVDLA